MTDGEHNLFYTFNNHNPVHCDFVETPADVPHSHEIRALDRHRFAEAVATDPDYNFTVEALPKRDFAMQALNDARDRYFAQYPHAKPNELIWTISAERRDRD